jgi:hypothetical protein
MCFAISVAVAADHTSGTETYTFILQQSDNADLSSADSILQRTIDYTDLALGHLEYIPIPPGWPRKRYLGIYADVSASDTPTVTLNCWLTLQSMIEDRQYFHTASAIL